MEDYNERFALSLGQDPLQDLLLAPFIEMGEGLVEEVEVGFLGQGGADGHFLSLSGGQTLREVLLEGLKVELLEESRVGDQGLNGQRRQFQGGR
jgi:hypothetical protein